MSQLVQYARELLSGNKTRRRIKGNRRKVVWYRDGKKCRYGIRCNQAEVLKYWDFHLDHIVPVYYNGNDYTFNLCCACEKCNLSRGAKHWIKPDELPLWRKIYGLLLMIRFMDYPKPIDFF